MITNYTGISGSRTAYQIASLTGTGDAPGNQAGAQALSEEPGKGRAGAAPANTVLIVVSSGKAAERLGRDLSFCAPDAGILIVPEEDDIQILYEAKNREAQVARVQALQALCTGTHETGAGRLFIIAPVSAVVRLTESPERYIDGMQSLAIGDVIEPADLRDALVKAGYTSAAVTESPGEFTSRGGILDVFPPALAHPLRIEFFGDEVDSIRSFDPDTQRSLENLMEAEIGPAAEFIPDEGERARALEAIRKEYDRRIRKARKEHVSFGSGKTDPDRDAVSDGRIEALESHKGRVTDLFEQNANVQLYADFIDYFDVEKARMWDFAAAGSAPVFIVDPARCEDALPESCSKEDWQQIYQCKTDIGIFTPYPEMIRGAARIDEIVNIRSRQMAPFNGQIDLFAQETGRLADAGYRITIASSDEERGERIREYLAIADVEGSISFRTGTLSSGFIMDDEKVCFITESDIYPESRRSARKPKRRKSSAESLQFSDLKAGDYIVHEVHGIGRFEGIRPVTADGQTKDYLVIRYAGSDVLYIPTEQLDIIQKYIGNSGKPPALSRLSGGSWKRTRERAKKAIEAIAEDLVKLYAERQAAGGYAFGADTVWQAEFEDYFPYTETDDQLRAVEEIKEDMEKPLPMDRLLCGDVGYGKTEVAARAIFKCLSEGKQAALLAPTTLLVNQHYHNLKERFAHFPFEVMELSRFRSQAEQKKTAKAVKTGEADLIIGTHRLLSEDVRFKDLGLLVIDEEQRFGVRHKDKIKQLKQSVDVLTLSATPIPRTLNMSLTGIKDISIIDEPPGDRLPVHTFVTPYEEDVIRNAIERELARSGQVFVVNNRITGLSQIRETVERLVPDAVVATAHGRMGEDELERTMLDFIDGHTDVLIATTIIENGIDIPNANTMIILNADRFGLAQLYQLRGRVGRSHRLAYAYLMYQPGKVLTEIARKRLTAIREFTEFGAGFKLAMRDLELRGAGNMLGEAQSGHIESIGYELYCKEIDRAVRRLKGEVVTDQRADITIDLPVEASVPVSYIPGESLRLQAYKKIASITSQADSEDILDELTDRYGDVPPETVNLLKVAEVRAHAEMTGVSTIGRKGVRLEIKFAENTRFNAYAAVVAKAEFGDALTIMSGRTTGLSLYAGHAVHTAAVRRKASPAASRSAAAARPGTSVSASHSTAPGRPGTSVSAHRSAAAGRPGAPASTIHSPAALNSRSASATAASDLDKVLALMRTLRNAIEEQEQSGAL